MIETLAIGRIETVLPNHRQQVAQFLLLGIVQREVAEPSRAFIGERLDFRIGERPGESNPARRLPADGLSRKLTPSPAAQCRQEGQRSAVHS